MKKFLALMAVSLMLVANVADAKGGGSSGGHGGGGGGRSGGGGFSSSAGRPNSVAAAPSRPSAPAAAPAPQTRTTTTTSTTTTRTAGGGYVGGGMMYGGMGMGYGYSNGLLTGLIIGNMMHPHNTVVYSGGGYSGNALLYPDGRVVNQQGYQVGTYQNGQFTAVNGGMVAQPAPADALNSAPQVAQPVIIQKTGPSVGEVIGMIFLGIMIVILFIILIGLI
jgi:hypothetical protein